MAVEGLTALLLDNYDVSLNIEGISGERLATRLGELSRIGGSEFAGARRLGFSPEVQEAKQQVMDWMEAAGLDVRQDGAGNVFGRLPGGDPDRKTILSGSHLDTVHAGGHFDGVLGVLSSLEVIEAWRDHGYSPPRPIEVVVFSDEEGVRFTEGMLGSKALTGRLTRSTLEAVQDEQGRSLETILNENNLSIESMLASNRNLDDIHAFVELHIEQGLKLLTENAPVGIVQGIAGLKRLQLTFEGTSGHAGTTPMENREDPLAAASRVIQAVEELPSEISETAVATVGMINVKPNSINVIPREVTLGIDVRDQSEDTRDNLVNEIIDRGHAVSQIYDIDYEWETMLEGPAVNLNELIQSEAKQSADELNHPYITLQSGAGHDAMNLAKHVPTGMIFVRSQGGTSHRPQEWSNLNDCVKGVRLLKKLLERLAERESFQES